MGIHGLTKLLGDHAPGCIKEQNFNNYFGRKIAVDASMHIYQFLIVVGRQGDSLLSNEAGEVTSHLQGMFYRTARMLEAGEHEGPFTSPKAAQCSKDTVEGNCAR
jgi:flap endonuclease-1